MIGSIVFACAALFLFAGFHVRRTREAFRKGQEGRLSASVAQIELSKLAGDKGDLDSAVSHAKTAVDLDPLGDRAWFGLAAAYMRARQYDHALAALRRTVALNDRNVRAHAGLGELLVHRGQGEEGRKHLEKSLQLDPDNPAASVLLGRYLAANSVGSAEEDRAEQLLRRAVDRSGSTVPEAHLDFGKLLLRRGKLAESERALRESARRFPYDERPRYSLAALYRRQKRWREARAAENKFRRISALNVRRQQLEARLHQNDRDAPAQLELARVYKSLGRLSEASERYSQYIRLMPAAAPPDEEFRKRSDPPPRTFAGSPRS